MKVILASRSPRRRELLALLQIPFTVEVSGCAESARADSAEVLVKLLARQKAESVAARHPNCIVIGADTLVVIEGKILGKPKDRQQAKEMLGLLQNQTHQVITGFAVYAAGRWEIGHETTRVTVAPMTDEEQESYLDTGEYTDKAGSYAIQGYFAKYIIGISGSYDNVVGLPLRRIYTALGKIGQHHS